MPTKAPRLCPCGQVIKSGDHCKCEARANAERKARYDKARPSSSARGYTGAWDRARDAYLAKHPWCAMCGRPADLVDHKTPHKGDKELFWDKANWQSLCTPCHSGPKQRLERTSKR